MEKVRVSPQYHIVLPKKIQEQSRIKPGQELQIIQLGDKLILMPIKDMKEARGFLSGMTSDVDRDGDRY